MNSKQFTEQVTAAEGMLYHISKTILKNDSDCADAVQEAITVAYSKLHTLKDERYFKTWLSRILINTCYQMCRANKKVVCFEDFMEQAAAPEHRENLGLQDAIMGLCPEFRIVIVLHYVEGFAVSEMAQMLKVPQGTIKSRMHRARAALRSVLDDKEVFADER